MVERCFRMAQVAVRFRLAPFGNRLWKFVEARSCKKQHQRSFFGGRSMSNELIHNPRQFDEIIHIIENARRRALKQSMQSLSKCTGKSVSIYLNFVQHQALETRSLTKLPIILRKKAPSSKDSIAGDSIA